MIKTISAVASLALLLPASSAMAQDYYIGGSVGIVNQSDSNNAGQTGVFTTGNLGDGTTLDVAAGTDYGWNTEFDSGTALSLEVGKKYDSGLRFGLELINTKADVDTHTDVTLGGGAIGALDAASIASSPAPLGVTVAQVVADGKGDISNTGVFANVYYDFNKSGSLQPYLGAGLGFVDANVDYRPSDIRVIDDGSTKFAYQAKAGVTFVFDSPLEVFGEATYRSMGDVETENVLFPGTLDIENDQTTFSAGLRYKFGQ